MVDFSYSSSRSYLGNGSGFGRVSDNTNGFITDGDNDDVFDPGDSAGPNPSFADELIYYGTINIGGTVYPVFRSDAVFDFMLYAQSDDELPDSITPGDINVGANFAFCFAPGTLIDTPDGRCPVENLSTGDLVQTAAGGAVPVLWVGRQTLFPALAPGHRNLVRIRAGALGPNTPHSDLTVTGDHGMVLDGMVINASALVDDDEICWVPSTDLPRQMTVYHVETEAHDVILANGAPSETFIDYAGRAAFDNHQEYLDLYGCERIIPEMDRPRISARRLLPDNIRAHLGAEGPREVA